MLEVYVIGLPAPQGSKRGFYNKGLGRVQMVESSANVKPWRQDVAAAAQAAIHETPGYEPYTGPVAVAVTFYMPRPLAHYRTGRHAGTLKPTAPTHCDKKPDVDKLLRSTLDALTSSGVFRDDAQVVVISGEKRYADAAAGARITVSPMVTYTFLTQVSDPYSAPAQPHAGGVDAAATGHRAPVPPVAAAPSTSVPKIGWPSKKTDEGEFW